MASEAVVSDHPTVTEQVKEEDHEVVKAIEHDNVNGATESAEIEKPKAEDSSPSPVTPLAEVNEKIEDKPIETPEIEELKKMEEEEKPKAEELPTLVEPIVEAEEKIEEKKIEPKAVEEVLPTPVAPLVEAEEKVEDKQSDPKEVKETVEEEKPKVEELPTPAAPSVDSVEITDKQIEVHEEKPSPAVAESEEKLVDEPPVIEVAQTIEKVEDLATEVAPLTESEPKIVDKNSEPPVVEEVKNETETPVVEAEKVDETLVADVSVEEKSVVGKESETPEHQPEEPVCETIENPKADEPETEQPKTVNTPGPSIEAVELKEEKADDLPTKESESAIAKDVENSLEETVKQEAEEKSSVVAAETEETTVAEPVGEEAKGLGEATIPTTEDYVDAKEDPPKDIIENTNQEKVSGVTADLVEEVSKEAVELKSEAENEAKNVITDLSAQPETKEVQEVTSSIPTTETAEKTFEGLLTSRDTELVTENGKEDTKSETVSSVETCTNGTVEDKTSKESEETKPKNPVAEVRGEEVVVTGETKTEKDAEDDDTKKTDDMVTSRDLPKDEEVVVKSTQKQSNNILSKVKHTFGKAKKAILGKSTNPKTPSPEPKGEVKV